MNCEAHDTSPAATTIVFFGTHVPLGSIDARLVSHYAADIREANADHQISDAWLLLLDETSATRPPVSTVSRSLGVNTCAWTPAQLFHRLPMLFQGLTDNSSPYQREPDYHMQRYYWLHASLVLWNMTLGQQVCNVCCQRRTPSLHALDGLSLVSASRLLDSPTNRPTVSKRTILLAHRA